MGWMAPLHDAVEADDVHTIRYLLLTKKGDPNGDDGGDWIPPLFLCKSAEAAGALLDAGADITHECKWGDTPGNPLHWAAAHGCVSVLDRLIAAGANVNRISLYCYGRTPLHEAKSLACVVSLLRARADVNALDNDRDTPLIIMAQSMPVEATDALLLAGAWRNNENRWGATALYVACVNSKYATARRLLSSGADPNRGEYFGQKTLHAAIGPDVGEDGQLLYSDDVIRDPMTAQNMLAWLGLIEALLHAGAEINHVNIFGCTPIMLTGEPMIIRLLLREGADINLGNDEWKSDEWKATVNAVFADTRGLEYVQGREMGLAPTERWDYSAFGTEPRVE